MFSFCILTYSFQKSLLITLSSKYPAVTLFIMGSGIFPATKVSENTSVSPFLLEDLHVLLFHLHLISYRLLEQDSQCIRSFMDSSLIILPCPHQALGLYGLQSHSFYQHYFCLVLTSFNSSLPSQVCSLMSLQSYTCPL